MNPNTLVITSKGGIPDVFGLQARTFALAGGLEKVTMTTVDQG